MEIRLEWGGQLVVVGGRPSDFGWAGPMGERAFPELSGLWGAVDGSGAEVVAAAWVSLQPDDFLSVGPDFGI